MSNVHAKIKQADATRLLKAARAAGFDCATITIHHDQRIELSAKMADSSVSSTSTSSQWDDLLT